MHSTPITTDLARQIRQQELAATDRTEAEKQEAKRKSKNFTQIYPSGWQRLTQIAKNAPQAFGLYSFFAEHIDPTCGAVVCDQQFLADQFGVTTRTIRNWLNSLEEEKAIVRIPVAGKVCAYALNPHEVWRGYDNAKDYAAFATKTLVNKDGEIKRRIMAMFSNDERPDEKDK